MEQEYLSFEEFASNTYQVETPNQHNHDVTNCIDYNANESYEQQYGNGIIEFYRGKDPESHAIYSTPSPSYNSAKTDEATTDAGLAEFEQAFHCDEQENTNFDMAAMVMQVETAKPTDRKKKVFKIIHEAFSTADSDCGSQQTPQHSNIKIQIKKDRKSKKNYTESPDESVDSFCGEKLHKKSVQNPRRNGPGLIIKRVRTGLVLLFDQGKNPLEEDEMQRLYYITQVVNAFNLTSEGLKKFEQFIKDFSIQAKTWNNILANLQKNRDCARIFVKCADAFLSEEGEMDFEDWLENGKLRSGKAAISENKGWFKKEFTERFASFTF